MMSGGAQLPRPAAPQDSLPRQQAKTPAEDAMGRTILVVDDDKKIVDLVSLYLRNEGYGVLTAYDGRDALEIARRAQPDLIVLDLLLPEMDGMQVCHALRAESRVPIIMLTARSTDEDKLLGLDLGADDYVTKPFNPRELVARVRAVLRRSTVDGEPPPDVCYGVLTISFIRHEVSLGDRAINLTPTEFRVLETLAREPGRAFSRSELLDRAFGHDYEGIERTVDVHVMNLRRKIEPEPGKPRYIGTVPGVGYRFEDHHV
jgi:DNA-binding response OmpR family regulator